MAIWCTAIRIKIDFLVSKIEDKVILFFIFLNTTFSFLAISTFSTDLSHHGQIHHVNHKNQMAPQNRTSTLSRPK